MIWIWIDDAGRRPLMRLLERETSEFNVVSRVYMTLRALPASLRGLARKLLSVAVLIRIRCLISDQVPELQIALKLQKRNQKGPRETAARRKYCSERSPWLSRLSGTLFQVPNCHTNTNLGKLASTRPCSSSKQAIISELFNVQRATRIRVNSTNSMMLIGREVEHSRPHHSLLFFFLFSFSEASNECAFFLE